MKYVGSKSRIAPAIVPIIQDYIDKSGTGTYIEPFVGGANVIDKIKAEYRVGFDKNGYLIALLQYVKSGGYCRTRFRVNSTPRSGRGNTISRRGRSARLVSLHHITESSSAGTPGRSRQNRVSGIITTKPAGIFRIKRRRFKTSTSPALIIEICLSAIALSIAIRRITEQRVTANHSTRRSFGTSFADGAKEILCLYQSRQRRRISNVYGRAA